MLLRPHCFELDAVLVQAAVEGLAPMRRVNFLLIQLLIFLFEVLIIPQDLVAGTF
jgi:hypothetical protein